MTALWVAFLTGQSERLLKTTSISIVVLQKQAQTHERFRCDLVSDLRQLWSSCIYHPLSFLGWAEPLSQSQLEFILVDHLWCRASPRHAYPGFELCKLSSLVVDTNCGASSGVLCLRQTLSEIITVCAFVLSRSFTGARFWNSLEGADQAWRMLPASQLVLDWHHTVCASSCRLLIQSVAQLAVSTSVYIHVCTWT